MTAETTLKFSDLSERQKTRAREEYTSGDYPGYEWWDTALEDAVRMAAIIGITISTTTHAGRKSGTTYKTINIAFSGFSSQGDGASFEGTYESATDASMKIRGECDDTELFRIADALTLLQIERRLHNLAPLTATITTSGRYSHSGAMNVNVNSDDNDDEHSNISEDVEDAVEQLMRDFADWIYKSLEDEYDYLTSDEYVDERLSEEEFDEDGIQI